MTDWHLPSVWFIRLTCVCVCSRRDEKKIGSMRRSIAQGLSRSPSSDISDWSSACNSESVNFRPLATESIHTWTCVCLALCLLKVRDKSRKTSRCDEEGSSELKCGKARQRDASTGSRDRGTMVKSQWREAKRAKLKRHQTAKMNGAFGTSYR